jgi:dipeptidyl-peptidase 4
MNRIGTLGLWIACIAASAAAPLCAEGSAPAPIELKDVFDAPPSQAPRELRWAPDGSRLAFVQGRGKTALRIWSARDRRTTTVPGDVSLAAITWSPSGDALAGIAEGDVYVIPLPASGEPGPPRRLTKTDGDEGDPKFSPDGRLIGFTRAADLFAVEIASGSERRLTQGGVPDEMLNGTIDWVYEEELDISSGWWWSPDSRRVAYLQLDERPVPNYPLVDWMPAHPQIQWQRYPKAGDPNPVPRLGVVDVGAAGDGQVPPTRWMDLGADTDIYIPRAAWTPDGRVAVQRIDRAQEKLDLFLCDAAAGSCRAILTEKDPHWINIDNDWRFLKGSGAGGKGAGAPPGLVWGSERDGYRHLYVLDMEGRVVRRLTEGRWTVTDLSDVDERSGWVRFTATEKDPRERHLYKVRMDGTGLSRVTRAEGWHDTSVAPGGERFVDSFSTPTAPSVITVRDAADGAIDTLDDSEARRVAGMRLAVPEYHEVRAADGTTLPAMLWKPASFDPSRKYPVLVQVYGGPHVQLVTRGWSSRSLWLHRMADQGVLVWMLDNRGSTGRGHAWETPLDLHMGRVELADQLEGVAYLRKLPGVDPDRIGIWGWSYGGYMTLIALTGAPGTFRAGVSVAPVTAWKDYDTIYTERYMARPSDNEAGYRDGSPLTHAAGLKDPLLLVHGTADDNVHMQNSVQFLDALVTARRPVELMIYPGKNHGIPGADARMHLFERIEAFLKEHL